jgi:hypothetical protein
MRKNLNSELKKNRIVLVIRQSMGSRDRPVQWDANRMGRGLLTAQIRLIICYHI